MISDIDFYRGGQYPMQRSSISQAWGESYLFQDTGLGLRGILNNYIYGDVYG